MNQRTNTISTVVSLILVSLLISTPTMLSEPKSKSFNGYTNLNVHEVWDLINDTSNGIQYLIDVRSDIEWISEHIDAPYPEYARHHWKSEWTEPSILQSFIDTYTGSEIILYCRSGGRSVDAANILIDKGFSGVIYNMIGGITSWKDYGYPTIANRPPVEPQITGPKNGIRNQQYNFTVKATDADYDSIEFYIKWGDGQGSIYENKYATNEQVIFSHYWESNGLYTIAIKARDNYFEESNWTFFEINITQTEITITNIDYNIGSVNYKIKNIGNYRTQNLTSSIKITGGILSKINLTKIYDYKSEAFSELDPAGQQIISTSNKGFIIGFGPILITISATADNADSILVSKDEFVIGPIIFIK